MENAFVDKLFRNDHSLDEKQIAAQASQVSNRHLVEMAEAIVVNSDAYNISLLLDTLGKRLLCVVPDFAGTLLSKADVRWSSKFALADYVAECWSREFSQELIDFCQSILVNPESNKPLVRGAIRVLRQAYESSDSSAFSELLAEYYTDEGQWSDLFLEEQQHRHAVLSSALSKPVAKAMREKDYAQVIRLLQKHQHELPPVLAKKLQYCLRRCNPP